MAKKDTVFLVYCKYSKFKHEILYGIYKEYDTAVEMVDYLTGVTYIGKVRMDEWEVE